MSSQYRVMVLENDGVVSDWLSRLITTAPELVLVGTAVNVADGYALLRARPDFALVDIMLDDGPAYQFIEHAKQQSDCKILVLSVLGDENSVLAAIRAGADGYMKKDATEEDLMAAITSVMRGDAPLSPAIARHLLRNYQVDKDAATIEPTRSDEGTKILLSPREKQVLEALAIGLNYKEVAQKYDLSHHTVAKYIKTIYRKLAVNSRAEAVVEGVRSGLIDI